MPIIPRKDVVGSNNQNEMNLSTRVSRDMMDAVLQFQEDGGFKSMSGAVRHLIAIGLESEVGQQPWTIAAYMEDGKAQALIRLDYCLTELLQKFKSRAAIKGLDYHDIDE